VHPGHVLGIGIIAAVTVVLPPVDVPADYQLGGAYPPPAGVGVVARDWREQPAAGAYGICYINGFQTQPEQRRWASVKRPRFCAAPIRVAALG
jgi:hypothetical protein